jgi:preprotein translocase subunit SecF
MLQITKYKNFFFIFSGILVAASIGAIIVWGLRPGIDFTGGSVLELKFENMPSTVAVAEQLAQNGYSEVSAQPLGEGRIIIKMANIPSEEDRAKFIDFLKAKFGNFEELRFDSIGPVIGAELRAKAFWQIALVVIGILFYIAYAFRKVSARGEKKVTSWQMSIAAIVALVHDLLIVLGLFAVLGKFLGVEVDSLFITALLTVLGFSVHDTIVVFDRVRENLQRLTGESLYETVNFSVNQTLTRSINTSSTVLMVLLALALFGGSTIFYFVIALLVGITVGTYSSIFIASALLLAWNRKSS